MINLLPNEEKKRKVRDFYLRLAVVIFILCGFAFLVGTVELLPAYFLSAAKKNLVNVMLAAAINDNAPLANEADAASAQTLDRELNLTRKNINNQYPVSEKILNRLLADKISGIKITEIIYDFEKKNVSLSGTAGNRDILLHFRDALRNDPSFSEVDLPVSNFVKGSNIPFSLTLLLAQ